MSVSSIVPITVLSVAIGILSIPHYIMMSRSITYKEAKKRLEERRALAEAYLRARIGVRNESNDSSNSSNSNNNNTTIDRLEKIALLLNKASLIFNQAMNSNGIKRRELLEEAFRADVDIVPYLKRDTAPYLTNTVLRQIKKIEKIIELEIKNCAKDTTVTTTSIDIDSIIKEARESFL